MQPDHAKQHYNEEWISKGTCLTDVRRRSKVLCQRSHRSNKKAQSQNGLREQYRCQLSMASNADVVKADEEITKGEVVQLHDGIHAELAPLTRRHPLRTNETPERLEVDLAVLDSHSAWVPPERRRIASARVQMHPQLNLKVLGRRRRSMQTEATLQQCDENHARSDRIQARRLAQSLAR